MKATDEGNSRLPKRLQDQLHCGLVFPSNLSMRLPSQMYVFHEYKIIRYFNKGTTYYLQVRINDQ